MIIAFTGKRGIGKTTACNYIISKHKFLKVSFKTPLLVEIRQRFPNLLNDFAEHYGITIHELFETKPPMVRHLLQEYGTEVRRADNPDYWIDQWKKAAAEGNILVDDARFLNEAQAVRDLGGVVVRLNRPDVVVEDTHASEVEMDQITPDYTLETSTVEELHEALDKLLVTLGHV